MKELTLLDAKIKIYPLTLVCGGYLLSSDFWQTFRSRCSNNDISLVILGYDSPQNQIRLANHYKEYFKDMGYRIVVSEDLAFVSQIRLLVKQNYIPFEKVGFIHLYKNEYEDLSIRQPMINHKGDIKPNDMGFYGEWYKDINNKLKSLTKKEACIHCHREFSKNVKRYNSRNTCTECQAKYQQKYHEKTYVPTNKENR